MFVKQNYFHLKLCCLLLRLHSFCILGVNKLVNGRFSKSLKKFFLFFFKNVNHQDSIRYVVKWSLKYPPRHPCMGWSSCSLLCLVSGPTPQHWCSPPGLRDKHTARKQVCFGMTQPLWSLLGNKAVRSWWDRVQEPRVQPSLNSFQPSRQFITGLKCAISCLQTLSTRPKKGTHKA